MGDLCVCCGAAVPEGRLVCPCCENKTPQYIYELKTTENPSSLPIQLNLYSLLMKGRK